MIIIPVTNDGARRIAVNFRGTIGIYTIRTYYNYTSRTWNMDIIDQNENELLTGVALVPNIDVLNAYPNIKDIFGEVRVAAYTESENQEPDDLGVNSTVIQFDEGEFVEPEQQESDPLVNLDDVIQ